MPLGHLLQRGKRRVTHWLPGVSPARQLNQFGQTLLAACGTAYGLAETQLLTIDHIIAITAPGIEHDRAAAGSRIEQLGRRRKALGAHLDGLRSVFHQRVCHVLSCSIISSAVALAEPTTPGTPAPGCVPAPTRYRLAIFASRLWGLNQALWVRMGSSENADPRCEFSSSRKSSGVKKLLVTRCSRKPG